MGFLLPRVSEQSLANQREVVRNERRQRYDNVPYGRERFIVAAALYPEGNPYRYLTIGRHEDLEQASLGDVRAFFERWYTPSNATLTLAGDFEIVEAKALISKWFGSFPALPSPRDEPASAEGSSWPRLTASARREVHDPLARLERVHYAWHAPAVLAEGSMELRALAAVLGDEGWGRLHRRLVVDEGLARAVSSYYDAGERGGSFDITVTLQPGAELARVEGILREEIDRITREPVDAAELARFITARESSLVWGLERLSARANRLQYYNHYTGDPGYIETYVERLHALTPARVRAAAVRWLARPRVEVVTVLKETS
jgi:predicted Zn-dependent peptidase